MECQLEGISVHYEIYGEGYPLISLHGFSPDHRLMTGCMEPIFNHRSGWQFENYPRSTFAVLDRAGHNLQIEQETLFNALVNEWLDRVEENIGK